MFNKWFYNNLKDMTIEQFVIEVNEQRVSGKFRAQKLRPQTLCVYQKPKKLWLTLWLSQQCRFESKETYGQTRGIINS